MKKRIFEKLYKDIFCIPKQEKLTDKVFRHKITASILTIIVCTVVMAASTFALFYMEVSTDNSTIASAYYSVTVDKAKNGVYICDLAFDDKHTFVIKADGTATTGYCKIQVGEQYYYTEQIPNGSSLTLTIKAKKDTVIIFTPQWGTSSYHVNGSTCGKEIFHSSTLHAEYEVEPTAKLDDIAEYYKVAAKDILIFNGIEDITAGMNLKIPGVSPDTPSYVAPVPENPADTDESNSEEASGSETPPPSTEDSEQEDEETEGT